MKRLFLCTLLTACMLLSACSTIAIGTDTSMLGKPFSAVAEITYGSDTCKAQIKHFPDNGWEFCITEPYAVEGLIVTIRDNGTKLSMYDMEGFADFSGEAVSTAKLIAETLEAAKNGTVDKNGDNITVSGDTDNSHYTLTLDDKGAPAKLTISGRGISAEITNYTVLPAEEQLEQDDETPFVVEVE